MLERIAAEHMRLTHAVDDAKKTLNVDAIGTAADILRSAYLTIDSWNPNRRTR